MSTQLRVLIVEDYEPDMLLTVRELRRGGYVPEVVRVDTAEDLSEALRRDWDVVLSDHSLPTLNAFDVLRMVQNAERDLPVIIVSGTIGEAAAVEAMRAGASDYIIKGALSRLLPAIERELRETRIRRQRRIVDQALKDSEQRFRDTVAASSDSFWETDAALFTRFLWQNGKEVIDPSDGAMSVGRPLTDIADNLQRPAERAAFLADLINRGPFRDVVHRWKPGDEIRLIKTAGLPFFDAAGTFLGYRGASIDVTAEENRHALEVQMLHSQRLEGLGTLAGGIAHDLNSLLVPAIGLLPLVLDDMPAGDSRDSVEIVLEAGQRARDLVRQILLFSRKEEPERTAVDLGVLAPQTLKMMRASTPPSIKIGCAVTPAPEVLANPGQIQQVLMNLVNNAIQAIGDENGRVDITVGEAKGGHGALLTVADTGPGMSRETLARMFEPFFTTKGVGKGTGLGLSVVHGIVTSHEGRIDVTSALGDGTRFEIFLPPFQSENPTSGLNRGNAE